VPAFVLLVVLGIRQRSRGLLVSAGVIGGIVGLTGAETFFFCSLIALVLALIVPEVGRFRILLSIGIPMGLVWATWLVPLLVNYRKYGGFDDTSGEAILIPPLNILGAWGLVLPFALFGLVMGFRQIRVRPHARVVVGVTACAATLLVVSQLAESLGAGFTTLGRSHRYWPLLHLSLVPAAGFGAVQLLGLFRREWNERRAAALGAAILVFSIPSPILGSLALPEDWQSTPRPIEQMVTEQGTPMNLIDPVPGRTTCVIAAPDHLIQRVYWYTGSRLVRYKWIGVVPGNLARVRWAEMRDHIPWDAERAIDNIILTTGSGTRTQWEELAEKYDVDHVITTRSAAESGTFGDAERRPASGYVVLSRTDCGD
jgi:hypothetical protein